MPQANDNLQNLEEAHEDLEIIRVPIRAGVAMDFAYNYDYFEFRIVQVAIAGEDKYKVLSSGKFDDYEKIEIHSGVITAPIFGYRKDGKKDTLHGLIVNPRIFETFAEICEDRVTLIKEPVDAFKMFKGPAIIGGAVALGGAIARFALNFDKPGNIFMVIGGIVVLVGCIYLIRGNKPRMTYNHEKKKWEPASRLERRSATTKR